MMDVRFSCTWFGSDLVHDKESGNYLLQAEVIRLRNKLGGQYVSLHMRTPRHVVSCVA